MFSAFSKFLKRKKPLRLIILGLDRAGKSTFLKRLQLSEFVQTDRTMGADFEKVKVEGLNLNIWDLGGQESFRRFIWPKLLNEEGKFDALLFVVDSSDDMFDTLLLASVVASGCTTVNCNGSC